MRIFLTTLATFFVLVICFLIVKMWGSSQHYVAYQHPLFDLKQNLQPLVFIKPKKEEVEKALQSENNLFLDIVITEDQKAVLLKRDWSEKEKPIRYSKIDEIKKDVIVLEDVKDQIKNKKIIFNLSENIQAVHEIFLENLKRVGLEKGDQIIMTSPFEAPIKSMKEIAPALVYGTTQPEILKIVAMNSMYLVEATNIRADIIIHPLLIRKQIFFTESILNEIKRRQKYFIVGPVSRSQKDNAVSLSPYGIIIDESID